jgi:hypothetical protein
LPVRQAHPFDGFDKLPFDKPLDMLGALSLSKRLRVCDNEGRLRMILSGVEWVRVPSGVEGQAILYRSRVPRAVS